MPCKQPSVFCSVQLILSCLRAPCYVLPGHGVAVQGIFPGAASSQVAQLPLPVACAGASSSDMGDFCTPLLIYLWWAESGPSPSKCETLLWGPKSIAVEVNGKWLCYVPWTSNLPLCGVPSFLNFVSSEMLFALLTVICRQYR